MEALLTHLNVAPEILCASFVGSLVAVGATAGARPNLWAILWTVVVGTGCGTYLGALVPIQVLLPASWNVKAGAAGCSFVIGVGGMPLSRKIISRMKNKDLGE